MMWWVVLVNTCSMHKIDKKENMKMSTNKNNFVWVVLTLDRYDDDYPEVAFASNTRGDSYHCRVRKMELIE